MPDQAPEDLYSDKTEDSTPPESGDQSKPDTEEDTRGDEQEAILPRSILAGKDFQVGDEVTLEVTAIRDGEISVKYSTGKDKGAEPESENEGDGGAEMPASTKDSLYD